MLAEDHSSSNSKLSLNCLHPLQIYFHTPSKYWKKVCFWLNRGRLHRVRNSTNTEHKTQTKIFRNIYLFDPTNSDSDLSRLPPSCGGKTLLIKHLSSNYRHLAFWKRGWGGVRTCPKWKYWHLAFWSRRLFLNTQWKYWHLLNPVLLTTLFPLPQKQLA